MARNTSPVILQGETNELRRIQLQRELHSRVFITCSQSLRTKKYADYYWSEDNIKKEIAAAEKYIGEAKCFLTALIEREELLRRDRERTEANKQVEQLKKEKRNLEEVCGGY